MKNMSIGAKIFFGSLSGIGISSLISLGISLAFGEYSPAAPALLESFGSLNSAVLLQTVFSAILGALFTFASGMWDKNEWSILKRTVIHYLITVIPISLFAYILKWSELTGFLVSYTAVYIIIWLLSYFKIRNDIKKLNEKLK